MMVVGVQDGGEISPLLSYSPAQGCQPSIAEMVRLEQQHASSTY